MLFIDDVVVIVVIGQARKQINNKLELRRKTFNSNRLVIMSSKTVFMECEFSGLRVEKNIILSSST